MNSIVDLLAEIRKADIRLSVDGERLLFDAPPDALTPHLRSEIGRHKPELMNILRSAAAAGGHVRTTPEIRRAHRNGTVPLSYAQQRLWFLDQLHPGTHAYNIPAHFRLDGVLNIAALEQALDGIVMRHEALRTRFITGQDGSPVQEILSDSTFRLQLVEFADANPDEWQGIVTRETDREATTPFDVSSDCLIRAKLLRRSAEEHVLLVTMHHIASDGWSLGVLVRELQELYNSRVTGREPSLPPLGIQYADFAVWQREWLNGPMLDRQLAYWRARLSSSSPVLSLPADRPRPAVQSYEGESVSALLPKPLARAVRELSERQNATLFAVLLAAYKLLLHHYSGQDDLSVGFPIANRNRSEIEPLIGFFVNTLIVRTAISGLTFRKLIASVSEAVVGAQDNQDIPYEKLVEDLRPERNTSYNPLFQAMFSLNPPTPVLSLTGLQPAPLGFRYASSKFDITLFIEDSGDNLKTVLAWSTALFDKARIRTMLAHYQSVLEWGISHPDRPVSELRIAVERVPAAEPAPVVRPHTAVTAFEAPQNTTEQLIADVWKQVLARDGISVLDNFFDIGGHSLLIVQVRTMLSRRLNRNIPVVDLFQFPTIRALANHLAGTDNSSHSIRAAYARAHQQRLATARSQRAGRQS